MKILIAGDFVPQNRVASQIEADDFSCINKCKEIIKAVDYAIVNFESPVVIRKAETIVKTGPNLKCSEKAMECIALAGFQCVTLANNHFRDYAQIGVEDTIQACKKYKVEYVGGGINIDDAERILYKEIDGIRLGIINVCENEWSIASTTYGGAAPVNPVKNYYNIIEAKRNADYVVLIVHGGIEGYQLPTPKMQETYRFYIDIGVDAVINHHQHCYSGYEVYKGKPIFYGLGNLCFDKYKSENDKWNQGYFVVLDMKKSNETFNIIPYIQLSKDGSIEIIKEKKNFFKRLDELNLIIQKKDLLNNYFCNLAHEKTDERILALEPFRNRFIKELQRKHLIPKIIRFEEKKSMFVRLNCESNRELLLCILRNNLGL